MQESDTIQEYDPTVHQPVRVWVFCRACRCRLQVRVIPRPALPFSCLCGTKGTLADFDVCEDEGRCREVASTFEVGYQAAKEVLASVIPMEKTRMYSTDAVRRLLEEGEEPTDKFAPKPFESEGDYREDLAPLMKALDSAGADHLKRHQALNDIIEFTFPRRNLRSAARSFCGRACKADMELLGSLVQQLEQMRVVSGTLSLRFPVFSCLIDLYEEEGDIRNAIGTALKGETFGLDFRGRIDSLKVKYRPGR